MVATGAFADPAPAPRQPCPAQSPDEAHWLADVLFAQKEYQQAGVCYEAAGDLQSANRAYFEAVAPQSAKSARQLTDNAQQAQALLRQVQGAFRSGH